MVAATTDCYAILGVTPGAEDVVIHAAYRALMRHYHPDSNPDPEAQSRARAITAAYAVLRDPAKRAEYDAWRTGGGNPWFADAPPLRPAEPPAMRGAGIAAALLAVAMVGVVWAWPRADEAKSAANAAEAMKESPRTALADEPAIELKPESERLAELHREMGGDAALAPVAMEQPAPEIVADVAPPDPPRLRVADRRAPASNARPKVTSASEVDAAAERMPPPADDRLATLERMSTGFFDQSMGHADATRKKLLVAARDRFAAQRKACRSKSCLADGYVREIRETGLIMESQGARPE